MITNKTEGMVKKAKVIWERYIKTVRSDQRPSIGNITHLIDFLQHFNSIHPSKQFTIEIKEKKLHFLDGLVSRNIHRLCHTVCKKLAHTNKYLHHDFNHHPSHKQ